VADFKASAQKYLERADAILLSEGQREHPSKFSAGVPVFRMHGPEFVTPEIVAFVAQRLARQPAILRSAP
jgi:hypothetical protein